MKTAHSAGRLRQIRMKRKLKGFKTESRPTILRLSSILVFATEMGTICYMDGDHGLEKDMPRAVELFERAAALGLKDAHRELGIIFDEVIGDEGIGKDMIRAVKHYEIAAKQGHVSARHNLGIYEHNSGNYGPALKHWMISAKLGHLGSLDEIKDMYTEGLASKCDYAEALRGCHDAVKEMSSPERDEAKAYWYEGN